MFRRVNAPIGEPVKQLKDFKRVSVAKGTAAKVCLQLKYSDLAYYDEQTSNWTVYPGEYDIMIGGSSEDKKLVYRLTIK